MSLMDNIYVRSRDYVQREVADEFILIPLRRKLTDANSLYVLNETGAFVWRHLDGHRPLQDIASALLNEYDVSNEQLERDLRSLVNDLLAIQAIQEVSRVPDADALSEG